MDLILREAQDQHLMDTTLLTRIWGPDAGQDVQDMMGVWDTARARLYSTGQSVLTSSEAEFLARKGPFKEALKDLCEKTEVMNREYTLRALEAVTEEIGGPRENAPPGRFEAKLVAQNVSLPAA
jgi:hypothetical protein